VVILPFAAGIEIEIEADGKIITFKMRGIEDHLLRPKCVAQSPNKP